MTVKDWANTFESLAKILAILVGGFWTYFLFVRNRQKYPRAKIEHAVTQRSMPGSRVLFRLELKVTNVSPVLLSVAEVQVRLLRVKPWPEDLLKQAGVDVPRKGRTQFDWPAIREIRCNWEEERREIEPAESDSYYFDFVMEAQMETVLVWSYVRNVNKKSIGWNVTSMQDVGVPLVRSSANFE